MKARGQPPGSMAPVSGNYAIIGPFGGRPGAKRTIGGLAMERPWARERPRRPSALVIMLHPERSAGSPGSPYMPVFWTKRAERRVLEGLALDARERVTPLIQLRPVGKAGREKDDETGEYVQRDPPTYEEHLAKQAEWLLRILLPAGSLFGDFPAVYVDVRALQRQHPRRGVLRDLMVALGPDAARFVPVVAPGDAASHFAAAARWHDRHRVGVALRVMRRRGARWPDLADLADAVRKCGCAARSVDLVVDARHVDPHEVDGLADSLPDVLSEYCWKAWRSVTLAAGGFPKSISALPYSVSRLARWDLVLWKRVAFALRSTGSRIPRFGDYGVVNSDLGSGGVPPEVPPNIRYTDERHWDVYRRQRVEEMRDLCSALLADHPGLRGVPTPGDAWIAERADGKTRRTGGDEVEVHGKPETWTYAGLSHHVWFAAMQMIGGT